VTRYRFDDFILSPKRRVLVRGGREQPLIPRYFDLLVFLVEHRGEAVHRRDIFDGVWRDVVVSDSALSQAIRTIRRTLGDNSREPRFIQTVSRHGYRFVYAEVVEEPDDSSLPAVCPPPVSSPSPAGRPDDPFEPLLRIVTADGVDAPDEESRREAAEMLHALGTAEALARLGTRPRHADARALLRDARWESAQAGPVPILGQPAAMATAAALIRLRLRRVARLVAARWAAAALGGGIAGAAGGAIGGVLLIAAPGGHAPTAVVPVLAAIGFAAGALGAAGVGAGLATAEAVVRSRRSLALAAGGAIGGGAVGLAAEWLARWTLAALVGVHVATGGGIEGFTLGGAAALGFAAATAGLDGGLAAPRGRARAGMAAATAGACAAGALALALAGRPLVGGTIHAIAQASQGSQAALTPLGRLIGEPDFGPVSRALIGMAEGALFGLGLALGLGRRP